MSIKFEITIRTVNGQVVTDWEGNAGPEGCTKAESVLGNLIRMHIQQAFDDSARVLKCEAMRIEIETPKDP